MSNDNDTKKVIIPVNKDGNGGLLNRPFPSPELDYDTLVTPETDMGSDIPYQRQEPEEGTEPVSVVGARNRFFNRATKTNKYYPDNSQALRSENEFSSPAALDFPSTAPIRLGMLLKKGLPGRRTTDQPGGDTDLKSAYEELDQNTEGQSTIPHARYFEADNTPAQGGPGSSNDILSNTIQGSVLSQNRFSVIGDDNEPNVFDGNRISQDNSLDENFDQDFAVLQETLGVNDKSSPALTLEEMKSIAVKLIENAVNKTGPGNTANDNVTDDFVKTPSLNMSAKNVVAQNRKSAKGSYGAFNETGSETSYGQMNSPSSKFDGMDDRLEVFTALTLISATVAIVNDKIVNSAGVRPQGIKPTRNSFNDAISRGVEIFCGVSLSGKKVETSDAKINIRENPGFYTVFARSIMRDVIDVAEKFRDDAPMGSAPDTQGTNNLLKVLSNSKVISAINVFSAIGDIALDQEKGIYDINRIRGSLAGFLDLASAASHKSKRDSSNVVYGDSKDMPSPNDRRLAWRGSSTPSLFLLPPSVEFAHTNTGQSSLISTAHSNLHSTTIVKPKKISKEDVVRHERRLDAEYVPFYFQDLRTNEIVSFHAFLSQLDETYSPRYQDSSMMGRADPVRIYQNTSRQINLRFVLAATSREDFNEMWMKFNKMITLLYPQYSKGRTTKSADGKTKITMPFSQVMSASPMIRLRVGDVIRSNYSRFNLGRLFGAGTVNYNPGNIKLATQFLATQEVPIPFVNGEVTATEQLLESLISLNKAIMAPEILRGAANFVDALKLVVTRARTRPTSAAQISLTGLTFGDVVRIPYPEVRSLKKAPEEDQFSSVANFAGADQSDEFHLPYRDVYARVLGKMTDTDDVVKYKVALFADASIFTPLAGTIGNVYLLDHGDMQVFASGLVLAKAALLGLKGTTGAVSANIPGNGTFAAGVGVDYFRRATNFLRPENNAVVRSFEEVGGKGLAGFITNMQMGWIKDNSVWETDLDARAPKTFEIQMTFSPVHDIAPGLDHDGYTRAINYPVAESSNILAGDQRRIDEASQIAKKHDARASGARYLLDADYVDETRELGLRQEQDEWDETSLAAMRLLGKAVR